MPDKQFKFTPKPLSRFSLFSAVVSGILLFLSFPKYGSGTIAWIALIPLFLSLRGNISVKRGLLLGLLTGMVSHIGILYWIVYVVVNYGYLPLYLGIVIMLLLAGFLSIYTSLFAGGIIFFQRRIPLYVSAPVLWVGLEYIKSYFLTGFPWENLGYSQYLNSYIAQSADIFGVYGISFLLVLTNGVLTGIIIKQPIMKKIIPAAAVALILICVVFYGIIRSKQIDEILKNAPPIEVSLIQGNIDQSIKWHESFQKSTIDIYERLSLQNPPGKSGFIIWPETALPFNYQDVGVYREQVRAVAEKTKSWFIFGSTSYQKNQKDVDYYNSAYLLSPSGEIKGKYDKVHLVPYGEYVPLRDIFPFIKKLTAGMGDFAAGAGYNVLAADDRKIGILICYEGILPFAARKYKNEGAGLLVNITNDAWFGNTSAPFQHFSMAIFRAIETRLYLVRAANTGISAIVDPKGTVIGQTKIFEKAALMGNVHTAHIETIYSRFGDIPVIICYLAIIIIFVITLRKREDKDDGRKYSGNNR